MAFKYNPFVDNFDYVGISTTTSGFYRIQFERFILDNNNVTNKYIDLTVPPKTEDTLDLHVYGGIKGLKDYDYTVSGTKISWDSKDWDGILEVGDIIEVICYY